MTAQTSERVDFPQATHGCPLNTAVKFCAFPGMLLAVIQNSFFAQTSDVQLKSLRSLLQARSEIQGKAAQEESTNRTYEAAKMIMLQQTGCHNFHVQSITFYTPEQLHQVSAPFGEAARVLIYCQVIAKTGTVKAEPHMEAKLKTKKHLGFETVVLCGKKVGWGWHCVLNCLYWV